EEEVFFIVENMPSFQGGDENTFRNWVQGNLVYPEIAQENGISGRVFVQFAVNSAGKVVDVKVVRGVDPALDKEVERVVKKSPGWTPGKQRGRPVKVQFTMPIVFVLQ
ncbi:MAG: energy transducer TonB, partial [Bacteroidales bacterium]|nr:energy transducer TonB [Bacteroidales bacterium]